MVSKPIVEQPPLRFLDGFLQERNIRWLLACGALILLGSSLMLVVEGWGHYSPGWQYLTMLAYTVAIHAAGWWCDRRLGLVRTGIALQALTVLLVPVLFTGLAWLQDGGGAGYWLLLAVTAAAAGPATAWIFRRWLHAVPPTFLACYLLLSLAGAVLPLLPEAAAPFAVLTLWALFALGAVKVNRQMFWLTERHRLPRVFGFLPLALLGGQFLGLYAFHYADRFALEWLGLGCALTTLPLLLTAATLARVQQQRDGGLVPTLAPVIMVPVLTGMLLGVLALGLATAGVALGQSGRALTPTALVLAGLWLHAGGWLRQQAFVWAGVAAAVLGYHYAHRYAPG
ncbi:MAG: hypothetical protein R3202_14485, partial [Candidatus Competibacterales bacterium]|nr:hypothetical protein [Candidatus Competibacterales bacterium]